MDKLKAVMWQYRAGEFGSEPLSMHDILQRAGEPDLFKNMSAEKVRDLKDKASGVTKHMYGMILKKKLSENRDLESEHAV